MAVLCNKQQFVSLSFAKQNMAVLTDCGFKLLACKNWTLLLPFICALAAVKTAARIFMKTCCPSGSLSHVQLLNLIASRH